MHTIQNTFCNLIEFLLIVVVLNLNHINLLKELLLKSFECSLIIDFRKPALKVTTIFDFSITYIYEI